MVPLSLISSHDVNAELHVRKLVGCEFDAGWSSINVRGKKLAGKIRVTVSQDQAVRSQSCLLI